MVYDYIVIGSGFGGSVASLRLVEKGYKVLTLEQGKRFNPSDFPKSNWNIPKYLWVPSLRMFGFQKLSFYTTASILSGTGVGGGSLVYANTLYKPPDAFFSNPSWLRFGEWKKILEPFYNRASFMLGRTKFNKLNAEDLVFEEVSKDMNAHDTFETVYVGVNLDGGTEEKDPYFNGLGPLRKGCTECGGCMVGCRENAKNTLDRNYLWFAEKLGLELRTNAETLSAVSGAKEKLNNGLAITSVFHPDPHTHAEIVKYPDNSNAMKWFFGLSAEGSSSIAGRIWKLIKKTFSHPLHFLKTLFKFGWSTNMVIFLVMQTVDNAMKMKWKKTIFGGKMKIDNSGQKKVPAYIPVGQEIMERYAKKVGGVAQNILLEVLFDRPTTAHILGGCPMSETQDSGVVDKNLKVHGYPDFYITDGSVIQGNIGVNPSLTITAMSEYAMSMIPSKEGNVQTDISAKLIQLEKEWIKKRSE
jgi:choline dehydrogenase-like flavoprotein